MNPTLAGFIAFVRSIAGIPVLELPDASAVFQTALDGATATVSLRLNCTPSALNATTTPYVYAVYNLATDILLNFATDRAGSTFFQELRKGYGINQFVPGVVASTGGQGTSTTIKTAEFVDRLTMGDLQALKTPYGRAYLNFAMQQGTLWGMS